MFFSSLLHNATDVMMSEIGIALGVFLGFLFLIGLILLIYICIRNKCRHRRYYRI